MLPFVADYKGGFTAAPAGRCSGHRAGNDHLEEAHHDGFTSGELTGPQEHYPGSSALASPRGPPGAVHFHRRCQLMWTQGRGVVRWVRPFIALMS
jgi:hypothetical protein